MGCQYNDVSLSEITLSQVDCTTAVSFVFVDIAVFVTGFAYDLAAGSGSTSKLSADDSRTGSAGPGRARRVETCQIAYNIKVKAF